MTKKKKKRKSLNEIPSDLKLQIVALRTEILRQAIDPISKRDAQLLAIAVLRGEGTVIPKLTCEGK